LLFDNQIHIGNAMDIETIKTFLAVVETGSFLGAADVVYVTQSTVSVRIKTLEERLRTKLFDRSKSGATLTVDGHKFLANATAIVRLWNQSRMDVSLPKQHNTILRVGAQQSLWDSYLVNWLGWMRKDSPSIALRAEIGSAPSLIQSLVEGSLDICVLYRPQYRPGFVAEKIFEEEIVLVTTKEDQNNIFDETYILTYWGPEFQSDHALNFPSLSMPAISMDLGPLGLQYLVENKGSGYFPRRIAEQFIADGKLYVCDNMPVFNYPAYMLSPQTLDETIKETVLRGLNSSLN
jgi:DNA-binding transcriptional LysR family regulator